LAAALPSPQGFSFTGNLHVSDAKTCCFHSFVGRLRIASGISCIGSKPLENDVKNRFVRDSGASVWTQPCPLSGHVGRPVDAVEGLDASTEWIDQWVSWETTKGKKVASSCYFRGMT
jgi:hypothetical protein